MIYPRSFTKDNIKAETDIPPDDCVWNEHLSLVMQNSFFTLMCFSPSFLNLETHADNLKKDPFIEFFREIFGIF